MDKPIKHIFLFTPSVGGKHFEVDEKHVFAYFQCRSSKYMWRVRDLDLGSMINSQQDLTKLNTKQAAYVKGLYPKSTCMALVGIYHH